MNIFDSMFLSIRKFFGFLLPGFAWSFIIYFFFLNEIKSLFLGVFTIFQDKVILYIFLLLSSYFIGGLTTQLAFRVLDIFGGTIDLMVSKGITKIKFLVKIFRFVSEKLHVFNFCLLSEEIKKMESLLEKSELPSLQSFQLKEEYSDTYWFCKMYILDNSSPLSKESSEIEGEINFYAGVCFPTLVFGMILLTQSWIAGIISIIIAVFFALRFQHLRHDDIIFVFQAFNVLKNKQTKT